MVLFDFRLHLSSNTPFQETGMKLSILFLVAISTLSLAPACDRVAAKEQTTTKTSLPTAEALQAKIAELAHSLETVPQTGLSVAVVKRDAVLSLWHGGLENREVGAAVKPETLFAIGSVTKTFTSFLVAEQVSRGILDVEKPVRSYLPEFQLADEKVSAKATLRDLLSHRVGLPRHDLLHYATPFSADELMKRLRYLDMNPNPAMGFRKAFQYNNLMYMAVGEALEAVTHRSWFDLVEKEIFSPVGMTSSHANNTTVLSSTAIAKGYAGTTPLPYHPVINAAPAGSILSNANDMARWMQFVLRRGVTASGNRLLSEPSFDALFEPNITVSPEQKITYGMGWMLQETPIGKVIAHNGAIDGFSSMMLMVPERDLGIAVFANQNQSTIPDQLAVAILRHLIGSPKPAEEPESILALKRPTATPTQENSLVAEDSTCAIDIPTGRFTHPGYGDLIITKENDQLKFQYYTLSGPMKRVEAGANPTSSENDDETLPATLRCENGKVLVGVPFEPAVGNIWFAQ
jgi:CubicO group peptidase (beta-lactamase class C family)